MTTRTPQVPGDLLAGLRRARDRIDRHYADPLDLDALAATAGLSKYHFLRCFARTYGRTPRAYLTERRVERAQDLLRATNLTVTEVCRLVGYESLGSFSARFRRLVGTSPSAYQARWASTGAPRIPGCFVLMHGLSDRVAERSRSVEADRVAERSRSVDADRVAERSRSVEADRVAERSRSVDADRAIPEKPPEPGDPAG